MTVSSHSRRAPSKARVLVQMVIILSIATVLGLVYNAFSPDGIPLVKKPPTLQFK